MARPPAVSAQEFDNVSSQGRQGNQTKSVSTENIFAEEYVDISQFYELDEELGRGSFGVVKKCISKYSEQVLACKSIPKSMLRSKGEIQNIKQEIHIFDSLRSHPNIVELNSVFEDSENIHLVMEYCSGGDLFTRIKRKGSFSEREAAMIVGNLASTLVFAHENGILHRDIKPENILMVSNKSDTDIRLADFGSATYFEQGQKLSQIVGSPLYIAPSVLQSSYGTEADLWSLGVVMYILLTGMPPFLGKCQDDIFREIKFGSLNLNKGKIADISLDAKHLILLLMNRNVTEAISAVDVLHHSWIQRYYYSGFHLAPMNIFPPPSPEVLNIRVPVDLMKLHTRALPYESVVPVAIALVASADPRYQASHFNESDVELESAGCSKSVDLSQCGALVSWLSAFYLQHSCSLDNDVYDMNFKSCIKRKLS